jgi:Uma2 family endonuclease
MAVEIHSPSTRTYDRALKRQLYAEAGVPFLVFVDPATDPRRRYLFRTGRRLLPGVDPSR